LEFKELYLTSEELKRKLICPDNLMEKYSDNHLPIKCYYNDLVVKEMEKIISLDVVNLQNDFCGDSKMKQLYGIILLM
jgi:hypothetical protein